MIGSGSDDVLVGRLTKVLVPVSAAQVALAILTAVIVPGLAVSSSAKVGLIAAEAALAIGLVSLLIALRRRAREVAGAVPTTRNGDRL